MASAGWYVNTTYMCLIGLWKLTPGAISWYLSISVENLRRPNSTSRAGVVVRCRIAWTAIGITGVGVDTPQGVFTGDGAAANDVGELCTKAGTLIAVFRAGGKAVAVMRRAACTRVGTGCAGPFIVWPSTNATTAISAEPTLTASNRRA